MATADRLDFRNVEFRMTAYEESFGIVRLELGTPPNHTRVTIAATKRITGHFVGVRRLQG